MSLTYSYSTDHGATFHPLGAPHSIVFSWWKGARPAILSFTKGDASHTDYVDIDWAHYRFIPEN